MGSKVLLVEDEPASSLLGRKQIASLGYTVVVAGDGEEALKRLEEHPDIGVILTDCYMPKLDGFELAAAVKNNEASEHIQCVLLSADQKLRHRARNSKFFAWIHKPLKLENLRPVLAHPALGLTRDEKKSA